MVLIPDDKLKRKMTKNGSVLQFMYSATGAGKGLAAMGAMFMVIGALLAAALSNIMDPGAMIKMLAVIEIVGILLVVWGISMQKKKESKWAEAYGKMTGFGQQELHQVDEEFKQPKTVLFALDKGKDTNSLKRIGFITEHYIKFPGIQSCVFRLDNIVACFYTKKYLCEDGGYDRALVAYGLDNDWGFLQRDAPEKASLEIVKVISEHNPKIITDHHFTYEGIEYDAVRGLEDVIALHKRVYGRS